MKLFYSYCHVDEHFRDKVATSLTPLRDSGSLDEWHDRQIPAGRRIHGEIDDNIERSDIILLLLSPDYLASSECKSEMRTALALHQSSGTTVIPIVLRPCAWQRYPISDLLALPTDAVPITDWAQDDHAYLDISTHITKVVENMPFHPTTQYLRSLTEVEFISQHKADISIDDIFVFPNIQSSHDQRSIDTLQEIWTRKNHVILHGDERVGKTVLCRKLVLEESRSHRPVLLLSGRDIATSLNHEPLIRRTFHDNFRGSYDYWRTRKNKMLIIDDVSHTTSSPFITYAKEHFDRILITISTDEYLSFFTGEESLGDFELLTLNPLGHATQEELIRKWLSLNSNASARTISDGQVDEIEDRLNSVIINNKVVPRYPFYVLSILQTLEAFMPQGLQITAYGHCYQALITAQLLRMGISSADLDAALNFLRYFAYVALTESKRCSHTRFAEFLDEYRAEFEIKDSIWRRITSEGSLILRRTTRGYEFKHPFVYYFFAGHHLARRSTENRNLIERIADDSYARDNAYILTFVIHHAQDNDLIDTILLHTACSLEDVPIATLASGEMRFVEQALSDIPKRIVSSRSVAEERSRQRQVRDYVEAVARDIEDDERITSDDRNEFYRLLKNMEILGQVLRNRHGSIRRDKLAEIVEFVVDAGLRAVSRFQRDVVHLARLCADIMEDEEAPDELKSEIDVMRGGLPQLAFVAVQLLLRKIVITIRKPEVSRIVADVCRQSDTPAYGLLRALFLMATREEFGDGAVSQVARIYGEMKKSNNVVAMRLLSLEMQSYLSTHNVQHRERHRMFSILGIKYRPNRP